MNNPDRSFFGHPRGLATLFFTEMWERFSYYGMRAILMLYLTKAIAVGGLNLDDGMASAIYGVFTSAAYLTGMAGGWLADRFMGQRRAVITGGLLIAAGNFGIMIPGLVWTICSLTLIAFGTGLLKTNCTTLVGELYAKGDQRRDAGFSIYYMGINTGAMVAPLICGYLGQTINYRWAFMSAGLFMLAGLIQFTLTSKHLGNAGIAPVVPVTARDKATLKWAGVAFALVLGLVVTLRPSVTAFADGFGVFLILTTVVTFGSLLFLGDFTVPEKRRIQLIFVLFLGSCLFWSTFEQAGSTLTLFADRNTDNRIFGIEFPSSYYQILNSLFLLFMAPFFTWLWNRMGSKEPSLPTKFGWGLVLVGAGFVVMAFAAMATTTRGTVGPEWLTFCYFLHSAGELCLSPVGLSAMSMLAPARIGGFMMGVWFLSIGVGNFIGGRVSSFYGSFALPQLFGVVAACGIAFGLVLIAVAKPVSQLMGAKPEAATATMP